MESIGTPILWVTFTAFVLAMLALDLGVFHREAHEVGVREALTWTAAWIALALVFNFGLYHWFGSQLALEFLTGYVIEKACSAPPDSSHTLMLCPSPAEHRVLGQKAVSIENRRERLEPRRTQLT